MSPVSGLDQSNCRYVSAYQRFEKDGITIIMISHDIAAAIKYATHILHIGENCFFGTRKQYLESSLGKAFTGQEGEESKMFETLHMYFQYPVRALRTDRRCTDRTVLLSFGRDTGIEEIFVYRGRSFPCGFRSHGDRIRTECHQQYVIHSSGNGDLCDLPSPGRAEYKNQRRCCNRNDLRRCAGDRLSSDESFFCQSEYFRGMCAVRCLVLHPF